MGQGVGDGPHRPSTAIVREGRAASAERRRPAAAGVGRGGREECERGSVRDRNGRRRIGRRGSRGGRSAGGTLKEAAVGHHGSWGQAGGWAGGQCGFAGTPARGKPRWGWRKAGEEWERQSLRAPLPEAGGLDGGGAHWHRRRAPQRRERKGLWGGPGAAADVPIASESEAGRSRVRQGARGRVDALPPGRILRVLPRPRPWLARPQLPLAASPPPSRGGCGIRSGPQWANPPRTPAPPALHLISCAGQGGAARRRCTSRTTPLHGSHVGFAGRGTPHPRTAHGVGGSPCCQSGPLHSASVPAQREPFPPASPAHRSSSPRGTPPCTWLLLERVDLPCPWRSRGEGLGIVATAAIERGARSLLAKLSVDS